MKISTVTKTGAKGKGIDASDVVFAASWNGDLVHEVIVSMRSNGRQGTSHTKDRSEVSGGGKKPWNQKGTGQARHGSRRSPIWVGGGVAFGPRSDRNYKKKINKKISRKALACVLTAKLGDNTLLFVDSFDMKTPKTKEATSMLESLEKVSGFETINTRKNPRNILLIADIRTEALVSAFENIPHATLASAKDVSLLDIANSRYVVMLNAKQVAAEFEARVGGSYASFVGTTSKTTSDSKAETA